MIICVFCKKKLYTLRGYVLHCKVHRNEPRCLFKCVGANCSQTFTTYSAFKGHFYRVHNAPQAAPIAVVADLKCAVSLCARHFHTVKELVSHLNDHIGEGRSVSCPVSGCKHVFTKKSSFTSHMCRKHKACSPDGIDNMYRETRPQPPDVIASTDDSENTHEAMPTASAASDMPENDSQSYLRNMCLFYLKLQGQLLIPASTIQTIVEEMQNVHELGQAYTITKVSSFLKNDMSLSDEAVSKICDCIKESDLFSACHQGQLRTTYSRNQTFTKMFKYTEPQKVALGMDENMTQKFAYYIPVAETLKSFLQSRLGRNTQSQQFGDPDVEVFTDLYDGQNFKCHQFFNENPESLKLILYQDSFEIVNPLGSAKKMHKVLAVYLSLANLPIHLRSNTDNMFLVLLCVEDDLKRFGVAKVFSELLADLKSLETDGINVDGETVKGGLYCIAGDNLGSHCIGGFTENFSRSQYFCRYCEITRSEFVADPNVCGPPRTPETYDAAVADLQAENIQGVRGIKVNSIFNALESFHVSQPGLPPCLGHDIFEGVLSYDLTLYLKNIIKKKKWFTYSLLNRRIKQFKYKGSEALTKPCAVNPDGAKLSGQAIQNWNLLRLLPVLIGDKVQNHEDEVWQLALQLKDIVDLICAQNISLSQIAYLDILIQEYLELRKMMFPEIQLKPKHHYLRHYSALILKFGPLIRLWTLRFESKHSYFKRCARHLKNFKNICQTLSQRHQMYQAYLLAGQECSKLLQVKDSCAFYPNLYSNTIKHAVRELAFSEINTTVTTDIQYKGTAYKKGQFLVYRNDEYMEFGELLLILIHNDTSVYVLMDIHKGTFLSEYHLYSVTKDSLGLQCININDLPDFYPLVSYILDGYQVIPLKHSIVEK